VLVTYGSRAVALPAGSDPYGAKYKGIWVCLELLKRALAGNYVNFGVFDLYGDPALKARAPLPVLAPCIVSSMSAC
jgi:exportin-7